MCSDPEEFEGVQWLVSKSVYPLPLKRNKHIC